MFLGYLRKFEKGLILWVVLVLLVGLFAFNGWFGPEVVLAVENKDSSPPKESDKSEATEDQKKNLRPDHNHPAFAQRIDERKKLVDRYIKAARINDPNVLRAMATVPRHVFVRDSDLHRAYADHPLPIGYNQTISQPYIVAYMTEVLKLDPNSNVLEVGTGSGYQAAVCAEIASRVYTIEIVEQLAKSAKARLKGLGYHNVMVKAGDGYFGWEKKGPFDAIIITAATGIIPPPLIAQLKPGARMILPLGSPYGLQYLVLVEKSKQEKITSKSLLPVRFVPMLGRVIEGKK